MAQINVKKKGELTNAIDIDGKNRMVKRDEEGIELAGVAYGIQSFIV
jgi:hypothetical protein